MTNRDRSWEKSCIVDGSSEVGLVGCVVSEEVSGSIIVVKGTVVVVSIW